MTLRWESRIWCYRASLNELCMLQKNGVDSGQVVAKKKPSELMDSCTADTSKKQSAVVKVPIEGAG